MLRVRRLYCRQSTAAHGATQQRKQLTLNDGTAARAIGGGMATAIGDGTATAIGGDHTGTANDDGRTAMAIGDGHTATGNWCNDTTTTSVNEVAAAEQTRWQQQENGNSSSDAPTPAATITVIRSAVLHAGGDGAAVWSQVRRHGTTAAATTHKGAEASTHP
jgi:hypothetical protein